MISSHSCSELDANTRQSNVLPSGLSGEELKMETRPLSSRAPSPALPSTAPATLQLLWASLVYFPRPTSLYPHPRAHRQRSHHTESKDPGAPRAASHAGDGGVGMAAQELRREQEGATVWGCGQSLSAPFLVSTVPRTPPAGLHQIPSILRSHPDLGCHSPWKKPSPAQGLLPPSHQIKPPAGRMRGKKPQSAQP